MLQSEIDLSLLTFWLDAHLSPSIAKWLKETYGVNAVSLRQLGLREADDIDIFKAARKEGVIFISKDEDLKHLIFQHGPPPKLIWLTCGNTSNEVLRRIISNNFNDILGTLIIDDASFIEITN